MSRVHHSRRPSVVGSRLLRLGGERILACRGSLRSRVGVSVWRLLRGPARQGRVPINGRHLWGTAAR